MACAPGRGPPDVAAPRRSGQITGHGALPRRRNGVLTDPAPLAGGGPAPEPHVWDVPPDGDREGEPAAPGRRGGTHWSWRSRPAAPPQGAEDVGRGRAKRAVRRPRR